jgi:hypothetical protein
MVQHATIFTFTGAQDVILHTSKLVHRSGDVLGEKMLGEKEWTGGYEESTS